jgi:hypothetical protein
LAYAADPAVAVTDPYQCMLQASAAATTLKTAYTNGGDNLHPGDAAALLARFVLRDVIKPWLTSQPRQWGSALTPYSAVNPTGNLISNSYPYGNNSGLSDGWSLSTSNVTGVAAKVARADGIDGELQQVTMSSGSAANCAAFFTFGANTSATGVCTIAVPPAGSVIQLASELIVPAGGTLLMPDQRLIAFQGSTTLCYARSMFSLNTSSTLPPVAHSGVQMTPPMIVPPNTDGIQVRLVGYGPNAAAGVVQWGRQYLRVLDPSEIFDPIAWLSAD